MKIVFYSTNSNTFDKNTFIIKVKPSNMDAFQEFKKEYPEHDFICISQAPAMFMPEDSVVLLDQNMNAEQVSEEILKYNPDFAVAMSFWVNPYDWLTVNDALVAERLKDAGVKTVCHSVETGLVCFDKWRTHQKLLQLGFNVPEALFVDHDLYFCAGSHKEVLNNVYKASVASQLEDLKLPLIIKDTAGLSSYGMTVVNTYGEARCYLNSKRNNSNRIVEEYITGEQFGTEIYGVPGHYKVMPPLRFSLNQYGITSPKQSAKSGPVELEPELEADLLKLAEAMKFEGCAQVDLIKSEGKWYIIEINPRLSGMSFSYGVLLNTSIFKLLYQSSLAHLLPEFKKNEHSSQSSVFHYENEHSSQTSVFHYENERLCQSSVLCMTSNVKMVHLLNVKLPLLNEEMMGKLLEISGVRLLNQTNDLAAKQEREKGFCECIITADTTEEIKKILDELKIFFPDEATIQQSETILK